MKTVTVHIKCTACQDFDIKIPIDTNEYGYFTFSDAYCPKCLMVMEQVIDGEDNPDFKR